MGELARKPGAPSFSQTPMELLTLRPGEGFSMFDYYSASIGGAVVGILSVCVGNRFAKRPIWAGIHRHVLLGAILYGCGIWWRNYRMASRSEDVAILKHYVSLHPEEFPPFEKQRIKDLFVPWHPAR